MVTQRVVDSFGVCIFNAIQGAHDAVSEVAAAYPQVVGAHTRQVSALVTEEIKRRLGSVDGIAQPKGNRAEFVLSLGDRDCRFRVNRASLSAGGVPSSYDPNDLQVVGNRSNAGVDYDFVVLWVGHKNELVDVWVAVPMGVLQAQPNTQISGYPLVDGRRWLEAQRLVSDAAVLDGLRADPVEPSVDWDRIVGEGSAGDSAAN